MEPVLIFKSLIRDLDPVGQVLISGETVRRRWGWGLPVGLSYDRPWGGETVVAGTARL